MQAQSKLYIPRRHTRKLLLPPGLISLILLPIVLFFYTRHHSGLYNKVGVMEVVWPSKSSKGHDVLVYAFDQLPQRHYHRILLTGTEAEDKVCLEYAQLAMRQMMASRDTVAGIQIHFGKQAKYGSFIRVLDICKIENIRTYMPYQDDIWVYNTTPPGSREPEIFPICGFASRRGYSCFISPLPTQEEIGRANKALWAKVKREFWLSGILFVGLAGLAVYRTLEVRKCIPR